jgi:hypothetical protein
MHNKSNIDIHNAVDVDANINEDANEIKGNDTTDMLLYNKANIKTRINDAYMNAMKVNAVDCKFNYEHNKATNSKLVCYTSSKDVIYKILVESSEYDEIVQKTTNITEQTFKAFTINKVKYYIPITNDNKIKMFRVKIMYDYIPIYKLYTSGIVSHYITIIDDIYMLYHLSSKEIMFIEKATYDQTQSTNIDIPNEIPVSSETFILDRYNNITQVKIESQTTHAVIPYKIKNNLQEPPKDDDAVF